MALWQMLGRQNSNSIPNSNQLLKKLQRWSRLLQSQKCPKLSWNFLIENLHGQYAQKLFIFKAIIEKTSRGDHLCFRARGSCRVFKAPGHHLRRGRREILYNTERFVSALGCIAIGSKDMWACIHDTWSNWIEDVFATLVIKLFQNSI